jgi:poly(beta-D-mannuronate) lyase
MEWKIERDGLYFKAGCYLQSNLEKGDKADAFGEIAIRKLYVTHK